ncbi:helix-turn-helix domain-containing protein [Brevundimonas sp. M1A4_2e]|uniref:helix-turn-helix domain-containing protein n=1 Tax=Brevundimonas diminuta TaxID=293 RepID=UPI001907B28D|nr:helix-turn-helix transcriptional regulator [Brevundimonas diminuta]MBK1969957.1 helix-turn-helix transcriptional regulator [Brevundimonas diminuta]
MALIALLGRNIRRYRNALGISQEELAFRAGMKRSYVSGVELGTRNPTVQALERLAGALDLDPRSLLAPDSYMK